jgi:lipopolysaccharide/colanic/teichoic acid biosynthesis glycosyltransferase
MMKASPAMHDSASRSFEARGLARDRGPQRSRSNEQPPRGPDLYFRRADTGLARMLERLSSKRGPRYRRSGIKRALDLSIGFPLAVISLPVIIVLAIANVLVEPGRPPFFSQWRVGPDGRRMQIVKLRSMTRRRGSSSHEIRRLGRFLRGHYLDELPQLFQVLSGQLSLVGIRILPFEVYEELESEWSPVRFRAWRHAYADGPLALTGAHQTLRGSGKEDRLRFHRDMLYARRASLGFDLYLLWRTVRKVGR